MMLTEIVLLKAILKRETNRACQSTQPFLEFF
jgi:hypothetical protein